MTLKFFAHRAGHWRLALAFVLSLLLTLSLNLFQVDSAIAAGTTLTGTIDGAAYKIEVPANWNGTLVLYSHGYVAPGSANPANDAGDPITGAYLLSQGYALAGSSYSATGWALEQAFHDQTALLDFFNNHVGQPSRTIAWGHSLGGIITAGLIQKFPNRFSAALPMCGVVAGGVGVWNQGLDAEFAFKTLLAPNSNLQLVQITNPNGNLATAEQILAAAQATPQGRARLALVAAIGDTPGWFNPNSPEPDRTDYAAREQNQFLWSQNVTFPFIFALRAELEARAGGNPSWNTNVDYRDLLDNSINRDEVRALYRQAGLSLEDDIQTLTDAPRIAANHKAVQYLIKNIVFNGQIKVPVLTMHTTGDGLVLPQDEQSYAQVIRDEGNGHLLRETFVHRAGHCSFTPAETITAFQTLIHRLDTGKWQNSTDPDVLNQEAAALGPSFNVPFASSPAFIKYHPSQFLRPFVSYSSIDDE